MAEGNFREYLKGDTVRTKKYFYVLRPVLACVWIERGFGIVPTEFGKLVDRVVDDDALRQEIDVLLDRKRAGDELDRGPKNQVISEFLGSQLARLRADTQPKAVTKDESRLDELFVKILTEVNGDRIETGSFTTRSSNA